MCDNVVIQLVEKGWDYKEVKSKCGNTGQYGQTLICLPCQENPVKMAEIRRHEANTKADNEWARSAGWGEY